MPTIITVLSALLLVKLSDGFVIVSNKIAHGCGSYQTCGECQSRPECGWCDGEEGTGLGTCFEGSYRGPLKRQGGTSELDFGMCPAVRWYFVDCPCKYEWDLDVLFV